MKKIKIISILTFLSISGFSQQLKEVNKTLSAQSSKGLLDDSYIDNNGNINMIYRAKTDKKSDELKLENYVFDSDLNFKSTETETKQKEKKENITTTYVFATVGGGNSFNVMSMKLNLNKEVWERSWDYKKQKYVFEKRISKELVKPKNSEGAYKGYASYPDDNSDVTFIIASAENEKDEDNIKYLGLVMSTSLEMKEIEFPLKGNYSLVYCGELESGNIFTIFAPHKGTTNPNSYVYIEVTKKGEIIHNNTFNAPSVAMAVMDFKESNGDLYFIAASINKAEAYNSVFANYAPINNPDYIGSANALMAKYENKIYKQEFENIHLLKFEKGRLTIAGTSLVSGFKSMVKTPPSQKKSTPYVGKKINIQNFVIAPNGDCFIAGQLEDREMDNGVYIMHYTDIVCLHFDNKGSLKAQYAVEKVNNDSKSEVFSNVQNFFFSNDGKTVYWELLEVVGSKGYTSFMDAYYGRPTFIRNYYPRIAKIDLQNATISNFNNMGENGKYRLYRNYSYIYNEATKTRYYIGHDEDYKALWLGKAVFE